MFFGFFLTLCLYNPAFFSKVRPHNWQKAQQNGRDNTAIIEYNCHELSADTNPAELSTFKSSICPAWCERGIGWKWMKLCCEWLEGTRLHEPLADAKQAHERAGASFLNQPTQTRQQLHYYSNFSQRKLWWCRLQSQGVLFVVNCGKWMERIVWHEKWCVPIIRMDCLHIQKSAFHVLLMCFINLLLVQPELFDLRNTFFIYSVSLLNRSLLFRIISNKE